MNALTRDDLFSLEAYHDRRADFKAQVMAHKKLRQISLGEHARLCFEDRLTIQYQVQEMLRIEKIYQGEAIQEELDAYNPLIPDGSNLKATFMIEFDDVDERRIQLGKMVGLEETVWLQVAGFEKVYPICNEDLERSTADKTSAVHFMRFEFSPEMCAALKNNAALSAGIEHPAMTVAAFRVADATRATLCKDFD